MVQDRKRAQIQRGTKFIFVVAMSGRHGSRPDRRAFARFLPSDASAKDLGEAVRGGLNASRQIEDDHELRAFFDVETMTADARAWKEETARLYGYQSIDAMYTSMQNVGVIQTENQIQLHPSRQEGTGWTREGIPPEDSRVVPADASDEEIGRAAIEALENCR